MLLIDDSPGAHHHMIIFVSKDPYMYGLQSTKIKALIREDFFLGMNFQ